MINFENSYGQNLIEVARSKGLSEQEVLEFVASKYNDLMKVLGEFIFEQMKLFAVSNFDPAIK